LWGESYGGHWVPGLAYNIIQQNALNNGFKFPLKGIALGDPWVDPYTQSQTYSTYAYTNSLINSQQMNIANYYQNLVINFLYSGQPLQAESNWDNTVGVIGDFSGGVNVYNVRDYAGYDENNLISFMNKQSTQSLLHVSGKVWGSCNDTVYDYYRADIMNSSAVFLPTILASGVTVMIYNGQDDLIVNTPGIENMISNLNWPGASQFLNAPKVNWNVNGNIAGYAQTAQNLTFVVVLASGHMAPFDQPVNIKDMVKRYVDGTGWN
jgi:carboxypeptidase C (cathepsin A)